MVWLWNVLHSRFHNSKREEKNNSTERCLKFLSPPYAQIYYFATSLRYHSLFLIPNFELWNLSSTLQNRCPKKFRNIQRKTPVLEFLFNKFVDFQDMQVY